MFESIANRSAFTVFLFYGIVT